MNISFKTRVVKESDRDYLAALLRENYRNPDTGISLDEAYIQKRVEEQLSTSLKDRVPNKLFLGVVNGQPVALAYVIADDKRGGFLIDDLYTQKEFEGRGIASALLAECENFVKGQGEKQIHLNVLTSDMRIKEFYEKRGWIKQTFNVQNNGTKTERQTSDIDPHTDAPTHLMVKPLANQ